MTTMSKVLLRTTNETLNTKLNISIPSKKNNPLVLMIPLRTRTKLQDLQKLKTVMLKNRF